MALPTTKTFSLRDVKAEIENNGGGTVTGLSSAFANATGVFDPLYEDNKDSLADFRGYNHVVTPSTETTTFTTTSTSSSFAPSITHDGTTLTWTLSGGLVDVVVGDSPSFDLSLAVGNVNFSVESDGNITYIDISSKNIVTLDVSNNISLLDLSCDFNQLTILDVSSNVNLDTLYCFSNNLTSLNISNNTLLIRVGCSGNSITSLDVSNNTSLTLLNCDDNLLTPTVIDNIYIDLDDNSLPNGNLYIDNDRTSASDTARANLITKGWYLAEY